MTSDVAARLGSLSQDHREGRLSLKAYRSLRAPLLDMLVAPEPPPPPAMEAAAPTAASPAWEPRDGDPALTTRPRSPTQATAAKQEAAVEALAVAGFERPRQAHPMTVGLVLLAGAGVVAAG